MSKMNFDSDTLFSAVKRKDVVHILAYVFNEVGETKAAEIIADKTRITDAAIKEVRAALVGVDRLAGVDTDDEPETPTDVPEVADEPETTTDDEFDIQIVDEGKKAKKDKKEKKAKKDEVEDEPETEDDMATILDDIKKAIAKGKKKKAKKLLAELDERGLKGSVIKDLKQQVKAL